MANCFEKSDSNTFFKNLTACGLNRWLSPSAVSFNVFCKQKVQSIAAKNT